MPAYIKAMTYDQNNIFAKILRGDIPCNKVYEDDHVLAFHDVKPHASVHVLIIPKGHYQDISEFGEKASAEDKAAFFTAISRVANELGLTSDGYRVIANTGGHGGQEVPHFHLHLLGGERLGPMTVKSA